MLIAHLSDLHLRDAGDVTWLERQLDHVAARNPAHLAMTGDLLDRWDPALLGRALDAFAARGFMHADRLTMLHGNHDLSSSGGHPRKGSDIWRLALRFWDPPPVIARRLRRFHAMIDERAPGVAGTTPFVKTLSAGARIAVIDTIPVPWFPVRYSDRRLTIHHAIGRVLASESAWLAEQAGSDPLILLMHHYPMVNDPYRWTPESKSASGRWNRALSSVVREVFVPTEIPPDERAEMWRAAARARVRLVLCGHLHRARFEWQDGIRVGLNGQSGAEWAGRTVAFYDIGDEVTMETIACPP